VVISLSSLGSFSIFLHIQTSIRYCMIRLVNRHTPEFGRRLFYAVRSRWNFWLSSQLVRLFTYSNYPAFLSSWQNMATSSESLCMRLNCIHLVCFLLNAHIFTCYGSSRFGFKTLEFSNLLHMDGCNRLHVTIPPPRPMTRWWRQSRALGWYFLYAVLS
jgi:hypothetical protein